MLRTNLASSPLGGGGGGGVAALALAGATLTGCQSANRQADAFGSGADRPPTPRTLHMMAKLIHENGRTDQAEYVLLRVLNDSPDYLPAYVELADMYIGVSRFEDARNVLRMAHNVAPEDAVDEAPEGEKVDKVPPLSPA